MTEELDLQPLDLFEVASVLVDSRSRRPSDARLRRAQSSIYYAVFHCLAKCCGDMLVGGSGSVRSKHAWRQAYRALGHGFAKEACKARPIVRQFPKDVEDFANAFVVLQEKRHSADYDPRFRLTKSDVVADIALADDVIKRFAQVPIKDRRAFSAHVLFRQR